MYDITVELAKRLGLGEHFPWQSIEQAFENQLRGMPLHPGPAEKRGLRYHRPGPSITNIKNGVRSTRPRGTVHPARPRPASTTSSIRWPRKRVPIPCRIITRRPPDLQPDAVYPFLFGNFRVYHHEHSSTFNNYRLMKSAPGNPVWINKMDRPRPGHRGG